MGRKDLRLQIVMSWDDWMADPSGLRLADPSTHVESCVFVDDACAGWVSEMEAKTRKSTVFVFALGMIVEGAPLFAACLEHARAFVIGKMFI